MEPTHPYELSDYTEIPLPPIFNLCHWNLLLDGDLLSFYDGTWEDKATALGAAEYPDYKAFIARHPQWASLSYRAFVAHAIPLGEMLMENEDDDF